MTEMQERVLAARWIIPVSCDPINGGWIRLRGDRIVEVSQGSIPPDAEDLGDVALLPGLINAHTHLEFSDCEQPIGDPGVPLADWIGQVIATRGETTPESKSVAVATGMEEMAATGTVLAGEITTPPCVYPTVAVEAGARDLRSRVPELVTFAEVLGLDRSRFGERLRVAEQHIVGLESGAISPHAPYSTSLEAIDACVGLVRKHHRPLAMHLAESPAERELICHGTGPFAESLRALGVWQDGLFPWGNDGVASLIDRLCEAPRVLLIHGNDLSLSEIQHIGGRDQLTVVYCPRTHDFFGYERHPVGQMLDAGVRVALGTDSRASNPDLNLWKEVQFLLNHRSDLRPSDVVRMATLNGANAFDRHELGRIEAGCRLPLGCVRTSARDIEAVFADCATQEYCKLS